ncbi:MAG: zinc-binding alcohol dehydrogenase [Planctomycetota bacterium]
MSGGGSARCYWVEARGRGALREVALTAPGPGERLVASQFSGISPGTERLVGLGLVPAADAAAMACQGMRGALALPVAYGYSVVGAIADGPEAGMRVFTMHPHQERFVAPRERLVELPAGVPSARATLLPNLETALNATWDAALRGDEDVLVVGGGAVGALLSFVLARRHGGPTTLVEADAARRRECAELPWRPRVVAPAELPVGGAAVALHASGTADGLQAALDAVGFEGTVVELSWYGTRPVTLQLGGAFHHQRKRIVASQVATIAPSHRAAGRAARTAAVLELLHDPALDALLSAPIPFAILPEWFGRLYRGEARERCPLVIYQPKP